MLCVVTSTWILFTISWHFFIFCWYRCYLNMNAAISLLSCWAGERNECVGGKLLSLAFSRPCWWFAYTFNSVWYAERCECEKWPLTHSLTIGMISEHTHTSNTLIVSKLKYIFHIITVCLHLNEFIMNTNWNLFSFHFN